MNVDGEYGPGTEAAVKKFQTANGTTADGVCRMKDWENITGMDPPSVFDRCLHLTAAFEGTGFRGAVGNFDGAGVTFGLIGLTLTSDLPAFLEHVEDEYPGTLERAFGNNEAQLRRIIKASNSEKIAWANSISEGANKYGLRSDWRSGFYKLGSFPEVQKMQVENARDRYWKICVIEAKRWKAADALDVAIFYDTAVQMGGASGRPAAKSGLDALGRDEPNLRGHARRTKWAKIIASGAKERWQNDVLHRRKAIADGRGTVHGFAYMMADWGLTEEKITAADLDSNHFTWMPASFQTVPRPDTPIVAAPELPPEKPTEPVVDPVVPEQPDPPAVAGPGTSATAGTAALGPVYAVPIAEIDLARDYKLVVGSALTYIAKGGIDRDWDVLPIDVLLDRRASLLPSDWRSWPEDRMAVALIQIICKDKGADAGDIDGEWGHVTSQAFEDLAYLRKHGKMPPEQENNWRDTEPNNAPLPAGPNPNNWPKQSHASLTAYYGEHGQSSMLVPVRCPWTLTFPWAPGQTVKSISVHKKCADSLGRVLEAVHAHYGEAEIKRLKLNLFGGCYNNRKMRGGNSWSTHAWGCALDWDPDNNALKWGRDRATFARPDFNDWWAIWEKEGWYSLGRKKNYDWMHVQACWL